MAKPGVRLRLFVGVYPPPASAFAMLAALRAQDLADHRETRPEQIHLTLQFIGDTDPRQLESVTASVERSASGLAPFELQPTRLISLPNKGTPRLIALETDAPPTLLELKRRLAHRLAHHVRKEQTGRFLPHFTLCRFSSSARPDRLEASAELASFRIDSVRLMRSVLLPDGAEHRELAAFDLE